MTKNTSQLNELVLTIALSTLTFSLKCIKISLGGLPTTRFIFATQIDIICLIIQSHSNRNVLEVIDR